MADANLKNVLNNALLSRQAHLSVIEVIKGLKPENRNKKPDKDFHSVWEELEHIRIGQQDIINYIKNPDYISPEWPEDYWPKENEYSEEKWIDTITNYKADLDELINLVNDDKTDLFSQIKHAASGHTIIRELIMVVDHTAYHTGQIVQIRKLLNDWNR